ncbi:MAG: endonuclease III [Syntrophorhabdales bacterium]|jgi:endonuclease-3
MAKEIDAIIEKLKTMHGKPRVELTYSNPLELTVAVVLSARCTDERVNRVTPHLFKKYTGVEDYLDTPLEELEEEIRPTGFYRNKARALKTIAREIKERFQGRIPDDIDELATVKGIGRKSANMIVGLAYGKPAIIVDTHMIRVGNRVGLTKSKDPDKIETDLQGLAPKTAWTDFSLLMIIHGRYLCKAKKPECPRCLLRDDCAYFQEGRYEGT